MENNNSYYNTNRLVGSELIKACEDAKRQEEVVAQIFKANKEKNLTADEVHSAYVKITSKHNVPLTSIRRAITNLCREDYDFLLEKTEELRGGQYGKQVHTFRIREEHKDKSQMEIFDLI